MPSELDYEEIEGGGFSEQRLRQEIIKRSVSDKWSEARLEWDPSARLDAEDHEQCLCGYHPIRELCYITNRHNGERAYVGNVCIRRFGEELALVRIFSALRRVENNIKKALNVDAIDFARAQDWITEWEHSFYSDTLRKRKITPKQIRSRVFVNRIVLERLAGRPSPDIMQAGSHVGKSIRKLEDRYLKALATKYQDKITTVQRELVKYEIAARDLEVSDEK